MSKIDKYLLSLFSILLFIGLFGCKQTPNNPPIDEPPIEDPLTINVTISKNLLEIEETATINVTLSKEGEYTIGYLSTDATIATVEDGVITALAVGETIIRVFIVEHPDIKIENTINVLSFPLTLDGDDFVFIGSTITLNGYDHRNDSKVLWESSNVSVATVDQNGVVTGIKKGFVTIKITGLFTNHTLEKTIVVIEPEPEQIEIDLKTQGTIMSQSIVRLEHKVLPTGAPQHVIWTSSDNTIATVDQTGRVTTLKSGKVEIYATSSSNQVRGTITLNILVDPIALITSFNVDKPVVQYVTTFGATQRQQWVYGSVSLFSPFDMNLKVNIIPTTFSFQPNNPFVGQIANANNIKEAEFNTIRSGLIKPTISSIIYHDTGNNNPGANAAMHSQFIVSQGNFTTYKARSWHYTVDDKEIIQHLPDNEVGWQGDTYLAYTTSIGIESCVDFNSDLYMVWHRTAKLMADLLVKHNLKVTDIKQHWDFSMKNCPQTLRMNNLYANAINMVNAEHLVLTELEGYTITFSSNFPQYVNNQGRIIKLPPTDLKISYIVNITNNQGYNESVWLYSTIPGESV